MSINFHAGYKAQQSFGSNDKTRSRSRIKDYIVNLAVVSTAGAAVFGTIDNKVRNNFSLTQMFSKINLPELGKTIGKYILMIGAVNALIDAAMYVVYRNRNKNN